MGKRSRDGDHEPHHSNPSKKSKSKTDENSPYNHALSQLPPPTTILGHIPAYTPFTVSRGLPALPEILDPSLLQAPFTHKSVAENYNRTATHADTTYERLEFLGDAQIEHIASRLIYSRFGHLPAGAQSQLRELLVKNETLAEFARAYEFDHRVRVTDVRRVQDVTRDRGNKGFNKILGDVFEAYVAAVILSHGDEGFGVAEKWLTTLWAPKLVDAARRDRFLTSGLEVFHSSAPASSVSSSSLAALQGSGTNGRQGDDDSVDRTKIYDPAAKADLQKRILAGAATRLSYEAWKPMVELKGDQLGQNRHYIALYLTGYGYERKLLGKGEGKNKVEAGNWAATQAMYGEAKPIVDECEKQRIAAKEKKLAEEAEKQKSLG